MSTLRKIIGHRKRDTPSSPKEPSIQTTMVRTINALQQRETLETLYVIVDNILQEPYNKKFHCLNSSSPKFQALLTKYPPAMEVLQMLGYHPIPGKGIMKITPDRVDSALLQAALRAVNAALDSYDLADEFGKLDAAEEGRDAVTNESLAELFTGGDEASVTRDTTHV
eukprot:TRINITY_DN66440_c4_g1_i1.p1 TRINITY_DN66440_c4_g1~~TRINITY_DN66440_c4_g1_i1.p1  ORF type:complete len:180 (-),score=12.44 TRINITY_DN66440_c4_g1_i1:242-745(-)